MFFNTGCDEQLLFIED